MRPLLLVAPSALLVLAVLQERALTQEADAAERVFQLSESCARCHDASPAAVALRNHDGSDASPHGLWRGTMMAQSFFDPYWRAKMAREIEVGGLERAEVEALCLRCHAPAAHHHDRLIGAPPRSFSDLRDDEAARDGVSCSVCHRITAEGLGEPETFNGLPPHDLLARIWGPYPEPFPGPMRVFTGYEVTYGEHTVLSSLCATCHTLTTEHAGSTFPEQSPYLEWRNSVFSYESGMTAESRSCQACHMPDQGSMRIAHNPGGRDFPFLDDRPEVRGHRFVGGNAFMLELMADHADELGIEAPPAALRDTARATRRQLAQDTATVSILELRREEGALRFAVDVQNRTGHKLPTGYPGRRAWLEVVVTVAGERWFTSGVADERGRLVPEGEAFDLPHRDVIRSSDELQVYELVALDAEGTPTSLLTRMASRGKDNRLLPRGWRADGPHVSQTSPVGVEGDANFEGGRDRVSFDLADVPVGRIEVTARLLYQAVPPHWVDDLRSSQAPDAREFVRLYEGRSAEPEVLGADKESGTVPPRGRSR